ncbi:hypothetical protein [Ferrimicrobium sp.]|uniref:hypothetical protein n=1 Tax=Ferrimicrobium sp. TaxID=2926050 RepID=UPI0026059BFF|nr:hypothetical protein [Ferrimicrobium sp.]
MKNVTQPTSPISLLTVGRLLWKPGIIAGVIGGMMLAIVMMITMGVEGSGFLSPLNLGLASFVYTIVPPISMFPALMGAMGIKLPSSVMSQLTPALRSGHISSAMAHHLGLMLIAMHVPAAKVQMIGELMTGHATNSTVTSILSSLSLSARNAVMSAMPVTAGHLVTGAMLHLVMSAIFGVAIFGVIALASWYRLPGMRSIFGIIGAGILGGAVIYVVNMYIVLPAINPMMGLVPPLAFFIAHLVFGMVVGLGAAVTFRSRKLKGILQNAG